MANQYHVLNDRKLKLNDAQIDKVNNYRNLFQHLANSDDVDLDMDIDLDMDMEVDISKHNRCSHG